MDGLIHITDLSWGRVNHPEEIVALDQKINVVILDFDEAKKRIALGLKQLTPHPWEALDQNLKVGDKVKGRVVVMADYGAFVEIAPGVEGLIHVSEMSWSQHLRSAQEFMKVGDEVEADARPRRAQDVAGHQAAYARSLGKYRNQVSRRHEVHGQGAQLYQLRYLRRDRGGYRRPDPHFRPELDEEGKAPRRIHVGGR